MLKPTSKDGFVEQPTAIGLPRALLADFDIDGHALKKNHREWLDGLAAFLRRKRFPPGRGRWVINVKGRASKSGPNKHNHWLSQQRKDAVLLYLLPQLGGIDIDVSHESLGEEFAFNATIDENLRDRSVEVFAAPVGFRRDTPPPPPRDDPRPRTGERTFELVVEKIKVDMWQVKFPAVPWGAPIGGLGLCKMNLRITDPETDFSANYFFDGEGPIFAGDGNAHSTSSGRTQEFKANAALKETDFEGESRFTLAAGAKVSYQFGATGSLHDFKGRLLDFRLPPMDTPLDGRGTFHSPLKRGVIDIED